MDSPSQELQNGTKIMLISPVDRQLFDFAKIGLYLNEADVMMQGPSYDVMQIMMSH